MTQMDNDDSDVRARQVEADEMLARELQEEFYHELPGVGGGEIDASIAWGLQQEEDVERAASLRRQRVHPVLLLDEVTVDLDVVERMDLLEFFKEECEQRGAPYQTRLSHLRESANFTRTEGWRWTGACRN